MSAPVTVAVVSWNTRDLLERCLRSLEPEARTGRADVWVVDNASDDGSANLVAERFDWVTLRALDENLGFGPAVNLVAEATESEWLAPANADIELTPGALEALLAAGARHPDAGAIAPRLLGDDGQAQHSVYAFPTLPFTTAFNLGVQRLSRRLGDRMCLEGYWDSGRARDVDWAIAALLLVRRRAFEEAGSFDTEQWMYAEDLDLGWRLAKAGWHTRYEPAAEVRHRGAASTSLAWGEDRVMRWQAATYAWMARRRGWPLTRATALVNVVGAGARAVWLTPLARLCPQRWAAPRAAFARWAWIHRRAGLARRSEIAEHR